MKKLGLLLVLSMVMTISSCQHSNKSENNMKNEVIENIMARRSIRKYSQQIPTREILDQILECGINAPNGQNKQSWEIVVVDNPNTMETIKEAMVKGNPSLDPEMVRGCFRGAPVMIFIARDTNYDFSPYDCGLLAENIMLSAWSLGVGSICLGSPVRFLETSSPECARIIEMFGFSQGYKLSLCVGLGYAEESPEAKPRDKGKIKFL